MTAKIALQIPKMEEQACFRDPDITNGDILRTILQAPDLHGQYGMANVANN